MSPLAAIAVIFCQNDSVAPRLPQAHLIASGWVDFLERAHLFKVRSDACQTWHPSALQYDAHAILHPRYAMLTSMMLTSFIPAH